MPDDPQQPKKRPLSEISHLFLSSVRHRQTGGADRPQRMPPPPSDMTIDLTPEEFAQVYGGGEPAPEPQRKSVPVAAIIAAHHNGKQVDRVKQYARHLAGQVGRVGLIELDASELRLMCFEPQSPGTVEIEQSSPDCGEPRQMIEALEEMNCDLDQWLVLLPNPRTPEAKAMLREIDHWVLLSTCDHDGVVSSYRMLKGLADAGRPRLSLALLNAADEPQATRVFVKLAGVCQQFLDWPIEAEAPIQPAAGITQHLALLYRPTRDKAQLATAPQWTIVSEFLAAGKKLATPQTPQDPGTCSMDPMEADRASTEPQASPSSEPLVLATLTSASPNADPSFIDVIELPDRDVTGEAILSAVLRKSAGGLIECPVRPPMCGEARLAVGRDRRITLFAAARQGLSELRTIAQAYRWLKENRELIGMALPQFSIDAGQTPQLRLLVDRDDLAADALQPMLQSEHVTLQAYRKLRWGGKLGLFLEAA